MSLTIAGTSRAAGFLLAASLSGAVPALAQAANPWAILARPRTFTPKPTATPITPADLRSRLFPFADDSMRGRQLDSPGNAKGVEYIARELARLGLEPAGDSGTFFQAVPVFSRVFDVASTLAVGGAPLAPWVDYIPRDQLDGNRSIDGVPVIYAGQWGGPDSLVSADSTSGRFVIVGVSARAAGGIAGIPNRGAVLARFANAAGIGVVAAELIPPSLLASYQEPGHVFRSGSAPDAPQPAYLYLSRPAAARILGTPVDSAAPGRAGTPVTGTPRFLERPLSYPARNVVAILRGRDPALRGQYVAIGAHNDHVDYGNPPVAHDSLYILNHLHRPGGADDPSPRLDAAEVRALNAALAGIRKATGGASARPDSIYNGADDDGSGSMGVLEMAEWFAGQQLRPRRSLLFIWHVGEEEGLYGSEHFSDHPTVPRDSIVTELNLDMIGRGAAGDVTGERKGGGVLRGGPGYLQVVGSRRLSDELGALVESVNLRGRHGLRFDYGMDADGHPQEIYCRSDHYSYARFGIPIAFFTTGGHADYHQVTDEPQYIDYDRLARVSRFVADLAGTIANRPARLVVNHPKPDPHGACRQ